MDEIEKLRRELAELKQRFECLVKFLIDDQAKSLDPGKITDYNELKKLIDNGI